METIQSRLNIELSQFSAGPERGEASVRKETCPALRTGDEGYGDATEIIRI
jgi:hypothetical protein